MNKKTWIAMACVFAAWFVLNWVIHGVLLRPAYQETAALWRPEGEIKQGVCLLVTLISAVAFVLIYALFFKRRDIRSGLQYGLFLGIAWGAGLGYGAYAYLPIPYFLAQAWFWTGVVQGVAAGLLVGLIFRER